MVEKQDRGFGFVASNKQPWVEVEGAEGPEKARRERAFGNTIFFCECSLWRQGGASSYSGIDSTVARSQGPPRSGFFGRKYEGISIKVTEVVAFSPSSHVAIGLFTRHIMLCIQISFDSVCQRDSVR